MEKHLFTLDEFQKQLDKMVANNETSYQNKWTHDYSQVSRPYSKEEVERIIGEGSPSERIHLSRNYFIRDGFYKRIILYYATLLKCRGLLIPNPHFGQKLSNSSNQKRYNNALTFIDSINFPFLAADWSRRVLRDGAYYGVISYIDKTHLVMIDLPPTYCRTRFKDEVGNNIIEFDIRYFDSLFDPEGKAQALEAFPKEVSNYYYRWAKGLTPEPWYDIPTNVGICFRFLDGIPPFLQTIPATIDYDEGIEIEKNRAIEEIRKIIVQKIPHLNDGQLLFEPDEAAEMHRGAVGMMSKNPHVSVLTTYADVEGITSRTSDADSKFLERLSQNIFNEAGVTSEVFAATAGLALTHSLEKDLALMMLLAYQYENFMTTIINSLFGNNAIDFKYTILPVSWYNEGDYVDRSLKMASSGFSFLVPAVASGLNQRDIVNIKKLENDVLKLGELFVPLSSSYTQSGNSNSQNEGGAPEKDLEDKAPKTIDNQESIDNGGSI